MRAVYRETPASPPVRVEVTEVRAEGVVCKHADGRPFPGVFVIGWSTLDPSRLEDFVRRLAKAGLISIRREAA